MVVSSWPDDDFSGANARSFLSTLTHFALQQFAYAAPHKPLSTVFCAAQHNHHN
jgi:hypothetical protein